MPGTFYAMMARLQGKRCAVVGGGSVAERKTASLLAAEAVVTVISPVCTARLAEWAADGRIRWIREPYDGLSHKPLLEEAALVFAATDQEKVNLQVAEDAEALGRWVNVADRPQRGSFIVPSAVRRGKLTISVSTSGASPGLSTRIKQRLEREYGPEYEAYIEALEELRGLVQTLVANAGERRQMLRATLDWKLLPLAGRDRFGEVRARLAELIREQPDLRRFEYIEGWLNRLAEEEQTT